MPGHLYIHIPFCIRKCIYCDFFSAGYDKSLAEDYVEALCREIHMRKPLKAAGLKTVYIGGGTPTLLSGECLGKILVSVDECFGLGPETEITIEANPGTIDKEKTAALRSLGVNRISIGAQSFIDKELALLGRIHSSDETVRAVEAAVESGFSNLSVDLIYGIPGQGISDWRYNISRAAGLGLKHISAYELTPEKDTPFSVLLRQKKLVLPIEEDIVAMYYFALDGLNSSGYRHYEISNFAKPGFECRHNLNYWDRGEYLGVGAGAHSFSANRRFENISDIKKYTECIGRGRLSFEKTIKLKFEEALRETIFLGLRKTSGIPLSKFMEFQALMRTGIHEASAELADEGMLEVSGDCLMLTRKGFIVSNSVIVRLFEKLGI